MFYSLLFSISSNVTALTDADISPDIMQYLLLTLMGGSAALFGQKELRKQMRKMKWQMLKMAFKNAFHSGGGGFFSSLKNIFRLLLLVGVFVGIYFLLGTSWLIVSLVFGLAILLAANRNS